MTIFSEGSIRQQGDRCLIIDLGDQIDESVGVSCLTLAQKIRDCHIEGIRDVVASFLAVAVYFEPTPALGADPVGYISALIKEQLRDLDSNSAWSAAHLSTRSLEIPICYGGDHGPDLQEVAELMQLSPQAVIDAHCAKPMRVFMLGFAPGHPYIGIHDDRFAIPRKLTPRTAVPAGSLGVANRQSTIYPNRLPGGWQIIGATPLTLFTPEAASPTLLQPGDEVVFRPISASDFERIRSKTLTGSTL